jgi:hypothetical protein
MHDMPLDFPASPSNGQKFPASPIAGVPTYTWDGEKWTTTGGSIVSATPGTALPLSSVDPAVVGVSTNFAREDHRHPIDANSVSNLLADNGGLEVWQRTGPASNMTVAASTVVYTADRWYCSAGAAQQSTVGPVAGITNGSQTAAIIKRNSGQTGTAVMSFGYPLTTDEIAQLRGNKCAISFVAKAGANWTGTNFSCALYVGTGTPQKVVGGGFTGQLQVVSVPVTLTTTPATFSGTSAAVVPVNATQADLVFQWTPVGTAGADDSFTLDDVQLEIGAVAHPFARIPFRDMLEKCQAYYWKTFPYSTAPAQNLGLVGSLVTDYSYVNGAGCVAEVTFPRRMRVAPTLTSYAPDALTGNWTSGVAPTLTAKEWGMWCQGAGATVAGNAYNIHITADASI